MTTNLSTLFVPHFILKFLKEYYRLKTTTSFGILVLFQGDGCFCIHTPKIVHMPVKRIQNLLEKNYCSTEKRLLIILHIIHMYIYSVL